MTKFKSLSKGEILSENSYYTVVKIAGNKVQLKNDKDEDIVVDSKYVDSCLQSAEQFSKEEAITMTEMAARFISNPGVAITVNFNTKVKEVDVVKEIMTAYEGSTIKDMETAVKKAVKSALVGTEKTLRGRHYGNMNELGRIQFIDMEVTKDTSKAYDTRMKLVDPRTINFFISRGTKYTIK